MKKTKILFICIAISFVLNAQTDTTKKNLNSKNKLLFSLNTDKWLGVGNSIKTKHISLGVDVSTIQKEYFGKSPVGISFGIGVSSINIRSNNYIHYDSINRTVYTPIPSTVNNSTIKYKRSKLTLAYLNVPVEFFYSPNNGKGFYASLGGEVGYLLGSHTKYKGNDIDSLENNTNKIKIKNANIKNIEPFRYGIVGRIGFNAVVISAHYSLSDVYKANKAIDSNKDVLKHFVPLTIGITFIFL